MPDVRKGKLSWSFSIASPVKRCRPSYWISLLPCLLNGKPIENQGAIAASISSSRGEPFAESGISTTVR
jgi:hypothetical protein